MVLSSIGEVVKNGVRFDMKNWGAGLPDGSNLPAAIDQFFNLLDSREIDYLLVGGIALLNYIDGRNTQDIDFILAKLALDNLPEVSVVEENRDFARGQYGELQIDFLLTSNRLFEQVWLKLTGETQPLVERSVRISTVDGLVLLKLYALPSLYRQGKFDRVSLYEGDLTQLLLRYEVDLDRLLQELATHVIPSDLVEIRRIVADIETRVQRFREQQQRFSRPEEDADLID
ncbi:MAG: hypothetical protein HC929_19730 [Leptolyngbyaceae cyanobacterium SM2_5_2]|nr:hypothetical protein [Leptolyngbyaceae cyanobacterium SM2_5_2]